MAEGDMNYEKLFDLVRKERNTEDLQELSPDFYEEINSFLSSRKKAVDSLDMNNEFSRAEKTTLEYSLKNARKLVKDLLERRELKIFHLALNKSRTSSSLIDTSNLLEKEKDLFNALVSTLSGFRKETLEKLLSYSYSPANPKLSPKEAEESDSGKNNSKYETQDEKNPHPQTGNQNNNIKTGTPGIKIKLKENIPKFLGKDMNFYGPFDKGETTLPKEIAEQLVKQGKAFYEETN